MPPTVKLQISFDTLIEAIATLDLEHKRQLLDILEDQIFTAEEADMENHPEVLAEVEAARQAYQMGDYQTLENYIVNRSSSTS